VRRKSSAIFARKRLRAQKIQRHGNRVTARLRGAEIIGRVAAALSLEIKPTSCAMAGTLRHQHREAARDQHQSEMRIFRLLHLRALDLVLN
jgi:hypothetical protein